jgi:GcrA cell cycle regulator
MTKSEWTEELTEKALRLWDEELSASQIAAKLNEDDGTHFTRNAVVGRLHRLKAPKRGPAKDKPQGKAARHWQPKIVSEPFVPQMVEPTPRRLTLLELTDSTCKFECSGSEVISEFMFCGDPTVDGLPYCRAHCRIAYAPKPSKQKAAA